MQFTTLIDCKDLGQHLDDPDWAVVDCRYDLADKEAGWRAYRENHVAGATYAHVDRDLSGPPVTDHGRHPLPTPDSLNRRFSRMGIAPETQVVAYDQIGGAFAARLWWLLRYMGHEKVAVLDGGWKAWLAAELPVRSGEETRSPALFHGVPMRDWVVLADRVLRQPRLIDSRDPARYRGDIEPVDPVAGHIPGAVNHFWQNNLQADGTFKPPEQLRAELQAVYGDEVVPDEVVFYCGSGVTACHNLLAAAHAGLPPPRLYAGSWSDWCADPARPVAKGD
jgi:thiosulfate/3-mercaptopyruvate sulfurtransferase